mmetsp:Transcript_35222/g.93311  ORF Transcript_35222/g.93311 Transcript_35222/m.93311 type:complete len:311 (+) Transcript_35222:345-1277(+)
MVLDALDQEVEGLLGSVRKLELRGVLLGDHAVVHERLPVDAGLPERLADQDDRQVALDLARLHQRDDLEELVAGAQPARRHHQAHARVGHQELPREEVVELEAQLRRHVRVQPVLEGEGDAEAHRGPLGAPGALVGGLHHAGARAGAHGVRGQALLLAGQRPLRQHAGEVLGHVEHRDQELLLPEARQGQLRLRVLRVRRDGRLRGLHGLIELGPGLRPRGAEEHDDVIDTLLLQPPLGLLELAHDPDHARLRAVEELLVLVGLVGLGSLRDLLVRVPDIVRQLALLALLLEHGLRRNGHPGTGRGRGRQ